MNNKNPRETVRRLAGLILAVAIGVVGKLGEATWYNTCLTAGVLCGVLAWSLGPWVKARES